MNIFEKTRALLNSPTRESMAAALLALIAATLMLWEDAAAQTKRQSQPRPAPQSKEPKQPSGGDKVGVLVGEVKDSRTTGSFFAGLELELKIMGDALVDAKAMRLTIDSAVDDTGRNLIGEKSEKPEFKEVDLSDKNVAEAKVGLKNPVRQATAIQEMSGTVELFIPRRDADSVATVTHTAGNLGVPISAPALKAAGVEMVIWNKEQFEARKKVEEEKLKKEMAAKRKQAGEAQNEEDAGEALAEGLQKFFGGLLSSFARMEDNSLAFEITDPQARVVAIEFEDERGKPIASNGRMTMGSGKAKMSIYEFNERMPDAARIRIHVMTPKATIKVPFRLTNVPLP